MWNQNYKNLKSVVDKVFIPTLLRGSEKELTENLAVMFVLAGNLSIPAYNIFSQWIAAISGVQTEPKKLGNDIILDFTPEKKREVVERMRAQRRVEIKLIKESKK